ncbi:MAG TPA: transposase [Tepidisphaeraceae bacterium]
MPTHLRRSDAPGRVHFWTISCFHRLGFFWDDSVKQVAIDGLKRIREKHGICLVGYVIMPDHVHVLLYPHRRADPKPVPISSLLRDFKQHVGYYGKERLRDYWRAHRSLWSRPLNDWAAGKLGAQDFWNTRGYDFDIDRHDTLLEKVEYCHNNPVKRGLVAIRADWKWSSFRFFDLKDESLLAMDWRGEYPLSW